MIKKQGGLYAKMTEDIMPRGYLRNPDNIKIELDRIVENNRGRFPSMMELHRKDANLAYIIKKYHGGLPSVRNKLGYDAASKSNSKNDEDDNSAGRLSPERR